MKLGHQPDVFDLYGRVVDLAGTSAAQTGVAVMALVSDADVEKYFSDVPKPEWPGFHMTLAYLAKPAAAFTVEQITAMVVALRRAVDSDTVPAAGRVFGQAVFNEDTPDAALVALVQSSDLDELHSTVCSALDKTGTEHDIKYPTWIPHVTVGYNIPAGDFPKDLIGSTITFDRIVVGAGEARFSVLGDPQDFARLDMTARTPVVSTVHHPLGKQGGPGLFHVKGMQLPAYIQNVAHALLRGHTRDKSRAISMAIGIVRNWAHGHDGHGNKVSAQVQAAATKAIAEYNASRARAKAIPNKSDHARVDLFDQYGKPIDLVRHVRTAEGAKRFHVPIGTPIAGHTGTLKRLAEKPNFKANDLRIQVHHGKGYKVMLGSQHLGHIQKGENGEFEVRDQNGNVLGHAPNRKEAAQALVQEHNARKGAAPVAQPVEVEKPQEQIEVNGYKLKARTSLRRYSFSILDSNGNHVGTVSRLLARGIHNNGYEWHADNSEFDFDVHVEASSKEEALRLFAEQHKAEIDKKNLKAARAQKEYRLETSSTTEGAQALVASVGSGVTNRERLSGGICGDTGLVDLADGTKAVHKKGGSLDAPRPGSGGFNDPIRNNDAEELSSLVAHALEIDTAPYVVRTAPDEIYMTFVEGNTAVRTSFRDATDAKMKDAAAGHPMAILNALIANTDRHEGNYMITPDNRVAPIDHGLAAFVPYQGPFTTGRALRRDDRFGGRGLHSEFVGRAVQEDFRPSLEKIKQYRENIQQLKADFERRKRGDWFANVMAGLDYIEKYGFKDDPTVRYGARRAQA